MADARDFNPYITYINHDELKPGDVCPERMSMWYEIELVTDVGPNGGCVTFDQFIPYKNGTLVFRKPGDVVQGMAPYAYTGILFDTCYDESMEMYYNQGALCMQMHIDIPYLRKMWMPNRKFDFLDSLPPIMRVKDLDRFKTYFLESARLYINQPKNYQLYAKDLLIRIILLAIDENEETQHSAKIETPSILESQEFIDTHYSSQLMLEDLAKQASMSREHYCRIFSKQVGMSPMRYLTTIRVFHAKHLLTMSSGSLEAVASQCGFQNVNYFYSVFKKHTGMTPSQYRRHSIPSLANQSATDEEDE